MIYSLLKQVQKLVLMSNNYSKILLLIFLEFKALVLILQVLLEANQFKERVAKRFRMKNSSWLLKVLNKVNIKKINKKTKIQIAKSWAAVEFDLSEWIRSFLNLKKSLWIQLFIFKLNNSNEYLHIFFIF